MTSASRPPSTGTTRWLSGWSILTPPRVGRGRYRCAGGEVASGLTERGCRSRTMGMRAYRVIELLRGDAAVGTEVEVRGWVRTRRDSKAGISFIHLSDGSGFQPIQIVAGN